MFRRKDELDIDGDINDMQGSLLSEESETVSVLSPQKAAEYKAERQSESKPNVQTPQTQSASFSSPSTFGQTARPVAQPIQPTEAAKRPMTPTPPAAMPSQASPMASNSNTTRATSDNTRFRPSQEAAKPAPTTPSPSSTFTNESNSMLSNKPNSNERVLTVGNDILLKGEITACDRLVIEGKVDATVSEVNTMELAAAGSFNGNAEVEYAEISGVFEGNLTVRTSLVIHQNGRVSGNISYGEIEIARGGVLSGEIKSIAGGVAQQSSKKKEKAAA